MIKRFEGLRPRAAQLEDGRFTLGYGHTKTARGGAAITEADAEALLLYDLIEVAHAVNEWTYVPLNQNEFDALVSFAFNIGLENFRHSTTLRRLNEGRPLEAAMAMELWRRADVDGERIVVDALVRRRAFEKALFLKPIDAWAPAPSPVLPPKLDYDSGAFTPSSPPQVVHSRLDGDRAIAGRAADRAITGRAADRQPLVALEAPEDEPSASQAAAAAVTARLEALLADIEPDAARIEAAALARTVASTADAPPPATDTAVSPLFPEHDGADAPAASGPALVVKEEARDPGSTNAAALDSRISVAAPRRARARRSGVSPLLMLGLLFVGGVLFYSAVRWGFSSGSGDSALALTVLGWVAGALGIVSCAAAAYLLLSRLSDRD
ncbi:MAG TPA: lysozyme [Caulobacteraceae bacterium]|nr:lysozyme [Caulobacteraceae bacterium]